MQDGVLMRRKGLFFIILCLLISLFSVSSVAYADELGNSVYLGGMPAGFSVYTKGAFVNGFSSVICNDGVYSPAKDAGVEIGDVILSINNVETNNVLDIEKSLTDTNDKILKIDRNLEIKYITVKPKMDLSGNIKLGLFIRDGINGIGTITYIKGNNFASLGHPVTTENGEIANICGGNIFSCNITGVIKGVKGRAGELRGVFLKDNVVGYIEKNIKTGVYGKINDNFKLNNLRKIELGKPNVGDAIIFSTLSGSTPEEYTISIIKVDKNRTTKDLVIKITDEKLLENAGGIVQGLSGSPIIQCGKLVGAVTHVFINDPTRGFAISIDNMQ